MNALRLSLTAVIVQLLCLGVTQQKEGYHDISSWAKTRSKRFLIFETSGVQKLVVNIAVPIDLGDNKPWRSLAEAWNFQWQHMLPTTTQLWWNSTFFPAEGRTFSSDTMTPPFAPQEELVDLTATFIYAIVEKYMNNQGVNGRACLQRAICENAQVDYVGGLFDRIFQRFLTPEQHMDDHYKDPFIMGSKGMDCYRSFSACPRGDSIFDKFVRIEEVS